MRVPHLILLLGLFLAIHQGNARAQVRSIEDPPRHRLGLTLGNPQMLGISYEYALSSPLQVQANVGTVLFYSAAGGRVLIVPDRWVLQPYAFLGGGVIYGAPDTEFDGEGWTGFTWAGAGLRLRIHNIILFGELGGISNLDVSKGFDSRYDAAAVGFLVQF